MSETMTDSIYEFIYAYEEEHGLPPSQREIAEGCYINLASVARYLDNLEMKGLIRREPGKARGIVLLKTRRKQTDV